MSRDADGALYKWGRPRQTSSCRAVEFGQTGGEKRTERHEVQGGEGNTVIVTLALSAHTGNRCLFSKNFP